MWPVIDGSTKQNRQGGEKELVTFRLAPETKNDSR